MTIAPLETLLGYQLRRASAVMLADLANSLVGLNLGVTEMSVLFTIDGHDDLTQSDVGRALGIKRANMAPLAANLVDRGLIERVAVDGRSHALIMTPRGRNLLAEAHARVVEHEARFLRHLPAEDVGRVMRVLEAIWKRPLT